MNQFVSYLAILRKKWWMVALTALLALTVTLTMSYFDSPMFRARAQFVVSPGQSLLRGEDRDLINSISALDRPSIVATYAEIMNSKRIQQAAQSALQLDPAEAAAYTAQAVVIPDSSVVELAVVGPNPAVAAQLANAVGEQAIRYIQELYQAYNINILDPAAPPQQPFSPTPARDASVALFLGLVVGVLLAIISDGWANNQPVPSSKPRDERVSRPDPLLDLAPQQAHVSNDNPLPGGGSSSSLRGSHP